MTTNKPLYRLDLERFLIFLYILFSNLARSINYLSKKYGTLQILKNYIIIYVLFTKKFPNENSGK